MQFSISFNHRKFDVSVSRGAFDLELGSLFDILYRADDGTRGLKWFDYLDTGRGCHEVWLGRRHLMFEWGPSVRAWRRSMQGEAA